MGNYSEFSDLQLVDLLKSGDRDAFAEIYNRYKFLLHHHAWNKIRNKEETQDLVQEVFSMIWAKRETINIGSNLSGYLYTCINNQFLNSVAHKIVRDKYIDSIVKFSQTAPVITDHRVRENMLQALIDKEIANLPDRMREVFELSRKKHLSNKEIAEIMGTSELTVKKQMGYALKILRKKLGLVLFLASYVVLHHHP
ncbi:RNA polymerase sigma-70 factor [Pedobacter sp. MC2016-14]|uniref:RNA polymerase sigma factor n=1 Tax=Pedobacter sp. MC2016-14 TaxID=2897327 RepID=UPI001E3DB7E6|nr:RNA polymerase sigma-70 factor [Pedobacter sp. MC2016-14]MCD0489286.1 RNA polymerase sigma-70 factor [Pedobacter sp. MC2016-14]